MSRFDFITRRFVDRRLLFEFRREEESRVRLLFVLFCRDEFTLRRDLLAHRDGLRVLSTICLFFCDVSRRVSSERVIHNRRDCARPEASLSYF